MATLKGERVNRGLTVETVCARLRIKPGSYRYYERTGGMPRDPAVAKRIADFYKVKVTDLWPVEEVAA